VKGRNNLKIIAKAWCTSNHNISNITGLWRTPIIKAGEMVVPTVIDLDKVQKLLDRQKTHGIWLTNVH